MNPNKADLFLRGATMKYGRVGRAYVVVHPATLSPSDEDWKAFVADLEPQGKEISGLLIYAEGSTGPNAVQRKQITDMWKRVGKPPPIALVTVSSIARAMMTAVNYFLTHPIRAFAPKALDLALLHVGVPTPERPLVRDLITSASETKSEARAG